MGCMRETGMADLKAVPEGEWFCSQGCREVYHKVQLLLKRGPFPVPRWRATTALPGFGPKSNVGRGGGTPGAAGGGGGMQGSSQADLVALSWQAVKRKHGRLPVTRSVLSKVVRLFAVRPGPTPFFPLTASGHVGWATCPICAP